jgi:hypothetical protein
MKALQTSIRHLTVYQSVYCDDAQSDYQPSPRKKFGRSVSLEDRERERERCIFLTEYRRQEEL